MPHKRKRRHPNKEKDSIDEPTKSTSKKSKKKKDPDAGSSRLEYVLKVARDIKSNKLRTKSTETSERNVVRHKKPIINTDDDLRIKSYESVADFNRRVNLAFQPKLATVYKKMQRKAKEQKAELKEMEKEKEFETERKNSKNGKSKDENIVQEIKKEGRSNDTIKDFVKRDTSLRFGEQVKAPPILTSLPNPPKKSHANIQKDLERQRAQLSQKRILDIERKRVVDAYRQIKNARMSTKTIL